MKSKKLLLLTSLSIAVSSVSAFAASGTWTSLTSGTWSTAGNWSGGTIADGSGFTADFSTLNITADTTVAMDASHTISVLKFGDTTAATAGSWILNNNGNAANILTLDGAATVTVGTLGTNKTATISAEIAGTAGLITDGPGVLVLSGTNTYTGTTWVKSSAGTSTGTIQFSSAANLGTATSAIRLGVSGASTGVLRYTGGALTFTRGIDFNGNGALDASGSGTWNISGNLGVSGGVQSMTLRGTATGTVSGIISQNGASASNLIKDGSGSWKLTNANTYTGVTTIRGSGTNGVSNSFLEVTTIGNGGVAGSIGKASNAASNLVFGVAGNSAGQLNYTGIGESTDRLFTINGHAILVNNGTGALKFTNTGTIAHATAGGHTLTLAGSNTGDNLIASTIANGTSAITVTKTAAGTWSLTNSSNSYTGGTNVTGGTLGFVSGALGSSGNITVNGGALQWNSGNTQDISSRLVMQNSGTATLQNSAGAAITLGSNIGSATSSSLIYQLNSSGSSYIVSGANTYTGATTIRGSVTVGVSADRFVEVSSIGNGGVSGTFGASSNAASNLVFGQVGFSAGQLNYVGAGESTDRLFTINGHAAIVSSGTGALKFTNTGTIAHPSTGTHTLTLGGSNTGDNTIAPIIANGTSAISVTKANAGKWILTGVNTYTGATTISGGTLEIGGAGQLGSGSYAGNISNAGTLSINTTADQTLSGAITGAGALVKDSTGALTLSGNSSAYTGTTTVSAGTLLVSGQLGGDTSVSSAATLAGGGTIGGNLSFLTGSLLDISSALTGDALSVGGTVTFGSSFGIDDLAGVIWGSVADGIYTLIDTTSTDFSTAGLDNFGLANAYDLGGGRGAYFSQGSLKLVVIPEPASALLGGLGLLVLLRRRRA